MQKTPGKLPENTSIIIPRLVCRDPASEVEFCVRALEAVELNTRPGPDGALAHALLKIGPEMIMIEAEWPSLPSRAPAMDATSPVVIFVYVADVDAVIERATSSGAKVLVPPANQFWGDRIAWLMDPAGHVWTVATRIEQTNAEERTQRWEKILAEGRAGPASGLTNPEADD
ncbi:MAG: VOC family protein [Gemmatimonadaceae bacterium]